MKSENIVLIGKGGHSIACVEICNLLQISYTQIKIEDLDYYLEHFDTKERNIKFFVCLGDKEKREKLIFLLRNKKLSICSLIHPSAIISTSSKISEGCFIGANTILGPNTSIGTASIVNTSSIIEHGSTVGSYTNIGPNSVLCGNVVVGNKCFIGASATIIDNLNIVDNVLIAAGAVVINHIDIEYSREKGVPSKSW